MSRLCLSFSFGALGSWFRLCSYIPTKDDGTVVQCIFMVEGSTTFYFLYKFTSTRAEWKICWENLYSLA